MREPEAGSAPNRGTLMKMRLILSAGLLLGLSGCATYDYVDGGAGGYYRGATSVQRSYPYGYPYGSYGYGPYGYGPYGYGSYGYYDYGYPYPVHRPPYKPPQRPPHGGQWGDGHHPPPGHGNGDGGRPTRPPPADGGSGKSPWRDMDRLRRPQPRPPAQTVQRATPVPQATAAPRPMTQQRPAPARPPSQSRGPRPTQQQEP